MNYLENKSKICSNCNYNGNFKNSFKCELCGFSLDKNPAKSKVVSQGEQETKILSYHAMRKNSPKKLQQDASKKTRIKSTQSTGKKWRTIEILKFKNISGILVLLVSLYLWKDYLVNYVKKQKLGEGIELVAQIKDVSNVPRGIFSFTGDGYFAALFAEGLTEAIISPFPNFEYKYIIPNNQDPSYSVAIEMLSRGDIDFVFNGRPLTSTEYAKATLQNIRLQETEIAIDGIVFYVNPELSVSRITIFQLMEIFSGRIRNWKQLGGEDLPITPVILSQKNLESLGMTVSDNANITYVSNHTLAMRRVIHTPGAIGYASASLVQNQKLLKFLTLGKNSYANPQVINYIPPFLTDGKPNKPAFSQGTYPLVRRLYLVNSNRPVSEAAGRTMSNFLLSYQGQEIVDKAGFIPLRSQNK